MDNSNVCSTKVNDKNTTRELLLFTLGKESYGIDIHKIKEVKNFLTMTIIPVMNSPSHILGMANIHEQIVPIIDLRIFYQKIHHDYNDRTVAIIIDFNKNNYGLVVDSVSEIIKLDAGLIKLASDMSSIINADYIEGIASYDHHSLIVLNIDNIILHTKHGVSKNVSS